jgi:hypothetical protein
VRCWIGAKVCAVRGSMGEAIGPGLDKKWSNYFLPGMLDYKTRFFWILALTAVQVRWVNVEINFHLVLDLDGPSAHSDRLDAEGGLL